MSSHLWKLLNGVFCIYKPIDLNWSYTRKVLVNKLCRDLNENHVEELPKRVCIEGTTTKEMKVVLKDDYSRHPLVLGPTYQSNDIKINFVNQMKRMSGVQIVGINKGCYLCTDIYKGRLIRTYELGGILGQATYNLFHTGRVVEKSTYNHVTSHKIERVLMSIQAAHQRGMIDQIGVDPHSQAAYEALSKDGLIRPGLKGPTLLYGLKCTHFDPPNFSIEVACINETAEYLQSFIHELGIKLKTNAVCNKIRCIRYGNFSLDHALVRDDWNLESIIENIQICTPIANCITPETASLQELNKLNEKISNYNNN